MGILDHGRTWTFRLTASPAECVAAFAAALGGLMRTKWEIRPGTGPNGLPRLVARYGGRADVAAPAPAAAIGSQMTFSVSRYNGTTGVTTCTLAMTRVGKTLLFFTVDARFFRDAMSRVAAELSTRDDALRLTKA